jgi:hypothetical protein
MFYLIALNLCRYIIIIKGAVIRATIIITYLGVFGSPHFFYFNTRPSFAGRFSNIKSLD